MKGPFATPVAVVEVPGASALNAELKRVSLERRAQTVGVQAWANVNGPGDGTICHYHPGSFWSGPYYVADGGCADDPSLGDVRPYRGSGLRISTALDLGVAARGT